MGSEVFSRMDVRKSEIAKKIKEKYIKHFTNNKNMQKVFKSRRKLCPDAKYKPSEFQKFLGSYWWKKVNTCIHGQFERKGIAAMWKITEEEFFKWYLKKMGKGCYYCKQDNVVYALKKKNFPKKR